MTGRSVVLDPRTHAVRADLADIRLADRVFAPHYAAAITFRVASEVGLREERGADAAVLATLAPGDVFEVLDLIGEAAWGIAPAAGLVGYVAAAAIERSPA